MLRRYVRQGKEKVILFPSDFDGDRVKERGDALTRAQGGAGTRHVQAAWGSNTSRGARKQALGTLPMRNGSWHGAAPLCESANACIYNIHHIAPGDDRPPLAET